MKLLAEWNIRHANRDHQIQLLEGDLARLPPEHAVDILVISAFANDFTATSGSLQ